MIRIYERKERKKQRILNNHDVIALQFQYNIRNRRFLYDHIFFGIIKSLSHEIQRSGNMKI